MTEKGDYCDPECIHYYIDYETRYDSEGCPYDEDSSRCLSNGAHYPAVRGKTYGTLEDISTV